MEIERARRVWNFIGSLARVELRAKRPDEGGLSGHVEGLLEFAKEHNGEAVEKRAGKSYDEWYP